MRQEREREAENSGKHIQECKDSPKQIRTFGFLSQPTQTHAHRYRDIRARKMQLGAEHSAVRERERSRETYAHIPSCFMYANTSGWASMMV